MSEKVIQQKIIREILIKNMKVIFLLYAKKKNINCICVKCLAGLNYFQNNYHLL